MPARLRPTAPIAADAILVGDPGRALLLAQDLLEQPKMSNHARGLWGYSGRTPDGHELTVQSTGMGGPSAAVVLADLAELGVRRAIRIGTGAGVGSSLEPGSLLIVSKAWIHLLRGPLIGSGTATEPREWEGVDPDPELTAAMERGLVEGASGTVVSLDALHSPRNLPPGLPGDAVDMQTASLFAAATKFGVGVAAVLVISETAAGGLPDEELEAAAKRVGGACAKALSA